MSLKEIFFGEGASFKGANYVQLIKDSIIGFLLAIILGYGTWWFAEWAKVLPGIKGTFYASLFDTLVIAVIIGLAIGVIIRRFQRFFLKVLPGILMAQIIMIPIGIIFYGKNLNLKQATATAASSPMVFAQLILIIITTFVGMYYIGKYFGLSEKLRYLLGFGSSVCGAAAIGLTSPIVEAEPDETSLALVMNTILTVIIVLVFTGLLFGMMSAESYARMAGDLTPQTGFTKVALSKLGDSFKDLQTFGITLKSIRVALLIISIPIVTFLLRRKIYIPWYLIAMIGFAVWFTYGAVSKPIGNTIGKYSTVALASALIAVGMNADVSSVIKKIWKPLGVALIAFAISLGVFFLTNLIV